MPEPPPATPHARAPVAEPAQIGDPCPSRVDPFVPADVAEASSLILGTWIYCEGFVFDRTSASEVGVEFTADGRWYRVADAGAGGLLRMEGLEQQGSWAFVNVPDNPQLNMALLGSGSFGLPMDFYGTPLALMNTFPVPPGRDISFVPWTGAAPVPGLPGDVEAGPCGLPKDPVYPTSAAQVEQLLFGTWLICDGVLPFGPPAFGEVGLFFDPDGRFARVYDDGAGGLIRGEGASQEGTWNVLDHDPGNPLGSYQLNLVGLDGASPSFFPTFLNQPPHVRFDFRAGYFPTEVQPIPGPLPTPLPPEPPPGVDLPATGSNLMLVLFAIASIQLGLLLLRIAGRRVR